MANYLTDRDLQDYGTDLADFSQRAALQAVAPHLQNLEQSNAELQRRLAREARRNLDQRVAAAVPDFREIDRNPDWHRWLLTVDPLSGRIRQQLLDDAIAHTDEARVVSFFRSFLQENQTTGQSTHHHATRRSAPSGQIYTRSRIAELYSAHRKGAYVAREAEWAQQEADIIAASREGRVVGGMSLDGK